MCMQMDACLKKEQISTLFVLVGALEGGFRGGVGGQGGQPQKVYVPSKQKTASCQERPKLSSMVEDMYMLDRLNKCVFPRKSRFQASLQPLFSDLFFPFLPPCSGTVARDFLLLGRFPVSSICDAL